MIRKLLNITLSLFCVLLLFSCNENTTDPSRQKAIQQNKEPEQDEQVLAVEAKFDELKLRESQLKELRGTYHLNSIICYIGASTMGFYNYLDNEWKHHGYYITDSGKNEYNKDIPDSLLNKLNSLQITLDKDLSFSLSCLGNECLREPYQEDFVSTSKSKDFYSFYISEVLYSEKTYCFDLLPSFGDMYDISYQRSSKSFEIIFSSTDHYDHASATYIFMKQ